MRAQLRRAQPIVRLNKGLILYTPDGYMSAQIERPGHPKFSSEDLHAGEPDEYASAAGTYLAYSGPFHVENKGLLRHDVFVTLLPKWHGQTQIRVAKLDKGELRLGVAEPTLLNGSIKNAELVWKRAPKNA